MNPHSEFRTIQIHTVDQWQAIMKMLRARQSKIIASIFRAAHYLY